MIIPPMVAAAGLSAAGGLAGSLFGGGGGAKTDYASLYAPLVAGQQQLTPAYLELSNAMAPYTGVKGALVGSAQELATGRLGEALATQATQRGLQAGEIGKLLEADIGLKTGAAQGRLATEMLASETGADITKKYADAVGSLGAKEIELTGQQLLPTATTAAQAGLGAMTTRNQQVMATTQANLDISKMQENTRNQLALQRGQIEGQLALKRFGAGLAMAGQRSFA